MVLAQQVFLAEKVTISLPPVPLKALSVIIRRLASIRKGKARGGKVYLRGRIMMRIGVPEKGYSRRIAFSR